MKTLKIRGGEVILDDDDYERIASHGWHISKSGYARRWKTPRRRIEKQETIWMHKDVLGVTDSNQIVDHKNLNKLDNRKSNLRKCTKSQNGQNRIAPSTNKVGVKGVSVEKRSGKYRAVIFANGKQRHLGLHDTIEAAASAYWAAAKEDFREYARQYKETIIH